MIIIDCKGENKNRQSFVLQSTDPDGISQHTMNRLLASGFGSTIPTFVKAINDSD